MLSDIYVSRTIFLVANDKFYSSKKWNRNNFKSKIGSSLRKRLLEFGNFEIELIFKKLKYKINFCFQFWIILWLYLCNYYAFIWLLICFHINNHKSSVSRLIWFSMEKGRRFLIIHIVYQKYIFFEKHKSLVSRYIIYFYIMVNISVLILFIFQTKNVY